MKKIPCQELGFLNRLPLFWQWCPLKSFPNCFNNFSRGVTFAKREWPCPLNNEIPGPKTGRLSSQATLNSITLVLAKDFPTGVTLVKTSTALPSQRWSSGPEVKSRLETKNCSHHWCVFLPPISPYRIEPTSFSAFSALPLDSLTFSCSSSICKIEQQTNQSQTSREALSTGVGLFCLSRPI